MKDGSRIRREIKDRQIKGANLCTNHAWLAVPRPCCNIGYGRRIHSYLLFKMINERYLGLKSENRNMDYLLSAYMNSHKIGIEGMI